LHFADAGRQLLSILPDFICLMGSLPVIFGLNFFVGLAGNYAVSLRNEVITAVAGLHSNDVTFIAQARNISFKYNFHFGY
jgi:hypothetical protein